MQRMEVITVNGDEGAIPYCILSNSLVNIFSLIKYAVEKNTTCYSPILCLCTEKRSVTVKWTHIALVNLSYPYPIPVSNTIQEKGEINVKVIECVPYRYTFCCGTMGVSWEGGIS